MIIASSKPDVCGAGTGRARRVQKEEVPDHLHVAPCALAARSEEVDSGSDPV